MATYQDLPDEDILSLYEARDETAIAATEHRYGGYCRAIADRILRVREDAEECVNDTWLHTWNAIPPTHPSSLKGFLGAVVRNLSINRLDYNRAQRRDAATVALDEFASCIPDGAQPIEDSTPSRRPLTASSAVCPSGNGSSSCAATGTSAPSPRSRGGWDCRRAPSRAVLPARGRDFGSIWKRRVFSYEEERVGAGFFPH